MKNKKWLLVLIIAFPSLFWLILETSTIHSRKLPHYGPRSFNGTDSVFHRVEPPFPTGNDHKTAFEDTTGLLFAVTFLSPSYSSDSYRIAGIWEYLRYKHEKIAPLPVVLVTQRADSAAVPLSRLDTLANVMVVALEKQDFLTLRRSYFNQKPYYVDSSFVALVDAGRHIRGYYDGRYPAEIKRLLQEFQHLKLKEVKKQMIETNEISTDH